MDRKERRRLLREELETKGRVSITDLAERWDVSGMTIRRDLARLAEMGIVTSVAGGAVYNEGGTTLMTVAARKDHEGLAKARIGRLCAEHIKEGSAVFLDAGSTCMCVAEALRERKNIAVLSSSLPVLNILAAAPGIQLFSVPGIYEERTKTFYGDLSVRFIRGFRIDVAILGTCALSEAGLTTAEPLDQALKRALIESARRKVVVTDHSKLGKEALLRVCELRAINTLVTDRLAPKDFLSFVQRKGVEVLVTP